MQVLVTGAAGFIGRHVVQRLRAAGHGLTLIDALEPRVHKTKPDLDGLVQCRAQYVPTTALACDAVVHLAAQVGVADSMTDPERYVRQNTLETAILMDRLPKRVKRVVVASSMSVYGEPQTCPVDEAAPVSPESVYGLSKYDQERLALLVCAQKGISATALRFFNVYGPGQALHNPYTGVLANFAQRLLRDQRPTVYEDGQQTRDFVYVEDVADAVVAALDADADGVFNVCTGRPTSIEGVALLMAEALGKPIEPLITNTQRPGDVRHCWGNPTRAERKLGWHAETGIEAGLRHYASCLL